jgi:iron complex outermembrane receptor protein
MKKRQALIFLGLVFGDVDVGFILTPAAFSAERKGVISEELRLLKEETVSIAARHEQPISEAPSNVYVITDEDIRHSGATDIPTLLRRIPGIEILEMSGADFNVSARGDNQLSANKLLVMVDGRSIYIDMQGQVYWKMIPVTLPEIKRIEVLKGPASVLYGFNAFDGIINIITKSAEEMKGTTLQLGGGEFGTITASAVQAGNIDKFGYRLSLGHDQGHQWRNRDALGFRANKFNVQTEYALSNESKLIASGGLVDGNRFDGPIVVTTSLAGHPTLGYANVAYERPNFFVRGWWNRYEDSSQVNLNPLLAPFIRITDLASNPTSVIHADTYNFEAQHTVEIGHAQRLTYGANYRLNTLSNNFIDQFSNENRLGFYVQDEFKLMRGLILVVGARYDLDTFIHDTISPRVSLLYSPIPDHTFRATVAVGYRPPTLFETHELNLVTTTLPLPLPSPPPVIVRGSNSLNPEQIVSYDAGYQGWFLKHRLRLRGDLFFNHISDLINFTGTGPTQGGLADIYGGEAGVEFLATRWLSGFANYSYEEINQTFTGDARRGAPRFKWNVGLRGEWENGLSGEAALHHVGAATSSINSAFLLFAPLGGFTPPSERVGSYNLLNLRAGYRFWKEKAEVAVSVFNALNDRHKEHPLGDTIGSRVMGWLTLRF